MTTQRGQSHARAALRVRLRRSQRQRDRAHRRQHLLFRRARHAGVRDRRADDRPPGEGRLQGRARHLGLPDRLLRHLRLRRIRWSRSTPSTTPARTIRRPPACAEQKFIVEGAPGHCEGHNVNAAVLVATALAAKQAMEQLRPQGHAQGVRRAGRGAARQPALFRARRLVRRRRRRVPQPYRRRVQRDPRAPAIGADLGDLHLPRRDRACRHLALERPRRARRRRADGCRHGAVSRAHAARDAGASRHHQWRRPAQRDPAHRGDLVVLPRPHRRRRD